MADLSKLSNDELMEMANGEHPSQAKQKTAPIKPTYDFSKVSNEDLMKMVDSENPANKAFDTAKSIGSAIMKPISAVGRAVDAVTGAPTRAAIGAMQDGKNPFSAFGKQFAGNPDMAPSGKQIASKAGLSTDETINFPFRGVDGQNIKVSPAGVAGFGIDVAADPTNLIPGRVIAGAGAKLIGKGAALTGKAAALAGKAAVAGTDLMTGSKFASTGVDIAKESGKGVKNALSSLFKPKVAEDFAELSAIAEKNGIDVSSLPEAVEFGHSSVITRSARNKAEGPLGQEALKRFELAHDQVRDATENLVKDISGSSVILNKQEAGALIKSGYEESLGRLFADSENTYRKIAESNPGLKISEEGGKKLESAIKELDAFANQRIRLGASAEQKSQANQLMMATGALRSTGPKVKGLELGKDGILTPVERQLAPSSFAEATTVLQNVGDAAYKKRGLLDLDPPDVKKLQGLYRDIRDVLIESTDPTTAAALKAKNAQITEFMKNQEFLEKTIGNRTISDEAIFRNLIESGDSAKIAALKKVLTPAQMKSLKGTFLSSVIAKDPVNQMFSFKGSINRLKSKEIQAVNLLDPAEVQDFADLLRLGDRFGNPILSTSGTGASGLFKDISTGVKSGIASDAFTETLKRRAREAQASPQSTPKLLDQSMNIQGGTLRSLLGTNRSTLEKSLKGSQVISSQDEERKTKQNAFQRRLNQK